MDLDKIKQRLAAATPGPWIACGHGRGGCDCGMVFSKPADCHAATAQPLVTTDTRNDEGMPYPEDVQRKANAALIAHAPQDLAGLLAEVERLRAGVPYRRGLPSVEQVRAHTSRSAAAATDRSQRESIAGAGGWWQVIHPGETYAQQTHLDHRSTRHRDVDYTRGLYRPCLPDGTPCEWPEAPPAR